jgi:hypothetical protein
MLLEEALFQKLSGDAAIVAIVQTRIFPLTLPEVAADDLLSIYPALTYARMTGVREHTTTGPSGIAHPRIQIDAWGNDYKTVKHLANVVRISLDGFRGPIGDVPISEIDFENDQDLYEHETRSFHVASDFTIWHRE